jgi:2',3'-cyclic-nucleotide 2'-phosphodiesterase/3'-nucleotidase
MLQKYNKRRGGDWMTAAYKEMTITILETSDLHGCILPIQYADNSENEVGFAQIATLIRNEKLMNSNILLVDNGDLIQGTPLAYYHAKINNQPIDPMVLCLNALEYDAAILGNHEFNYGNDVLNKAISESHFPWLSANILHKATGQPYFGKPYVIKHLEHGVKIGLLGLTTPYIPNWENPQHIAEFEFISAVKAAQNWVKYLREVELVDLVVVSYHGGFERDIETGLPIEALTGENEGYQLCNEVDGIDVLLTGHQHRSIAADLNGVAIIQPGHQGRFLGKVTLKLEHKEGSWTLLRKITELLTIEGVKPDSNIIAMVQEHELNTQKWLDLPIGQLNGDMRIDDPMMTRTCDNALIEFINKVQMEYSAAHISNTALFDNESKGFSHEITMRDIVSNYIYPNTLKVIRITGQDIKDALEQSAGYFAAYDGVGFKISEAFAYPKPQHYNYDMWEGITYRINISQPLGSRVTLLHYQDKPMDLEAKFDVVMNNYRAGGGGNYRMFQGKPVVRDIPTDMSELLTNYILEKGTIEASVNKNWEVIFAEE